MVGYSLIHKGNLIYNILYPATNGLLVSPHQAQLKVEVIITLAERIHKSSGPGIVLR